MRCSGVFDINLRKGNDEKHEFGFQASEVGFEGAAEGPLLVKNGSYLVNYRLASFRILDRLGIPVSDNTVVPFFQDFAVNLYLPAKNTGIFSLFGFGGTSSAGNIAVKDSSRWISTSDRNEMTELHSTGVVGLKHIFSFPDGKTYLRSVAIASYEKNALDLAYLSDELILKNVHNSSSIHLNYRLSSLFHHKFNAMCRLRCGFIASSPGSDIYGLAYDDFPEERELYIDYKGRTGVLQAFVQHQLRLPGEIEINAGLHSLVFLLNSNYSVEPRFGFKWRFSPNQSLNAGFGLHSRLETLPMYAASFERADGSTIQPNRDLDFSKAWHFVTGCTFFLSSDIHLKTEVYYQYLYNVPVEDSTGSQVSVVNFSSGIYNHPLSNKGTGRNYGLELTLEKYFTKNYYFLITGSLYDSKYVAADGQTYNTLYNGNYIGNLLGGKEFRMGKNEQDILGFNIRLLMKGGNRMTPVLLEESRDQGYTVYDTDRWLEEKAPDFFRWDAGISYRHNKPAYSWIFSIDIQNITDRKNIYRSYYNECTGEVDDIYLQGIIPLINFRIEFGLRNN